MTKPRGKGSRAAKEAKRKVVAAGIVAGKSTRTIAKAARTSSRHVQRLAEEAETQFIVTELMKPHRAKLEKLAVKVMRSLSTALDAKLTDKADHRARLAAIRRFSEIAKLTEGKAEETAEESAQMTWEEFVIMYRGRTGAAR